MIIKFWDNENYEYPLIDIWKEDFNKFKEILKEYQKDEEYNFDDFLVLLKEKGINVKEIFIDGEVFF